MTTMFDAALALVLKSEGGRVDDPRDPGGRTNEGITQAVYDAWRAARGLVPRTVYLIQPDEVSAIYKTQYADPVRFDDLPAGLGYAVFDAGVMSGPSRAARWLQQAVGATVDGHVGVLTVAAAKKHDAATTINNLCDVRLAFLQGLSTWGAFGKGWTNRVAQVRRDALAMVGKPTVVAPKPSVGGLGPTVSPVKPDLPPLAHIDNLPGAKLPAARPWWKRLLGIA